MKPLRDLNQAFQRMRALGGCDRTLMIYSRFDDSNITEDVLDLEKTAWLAHLPKEFHATEQGGLIPGVEDFRSQLTTSTDGWTFDNDALRIIITRVGAALIYLRLNENFLINDGGNTNVIYSPWCEAWATTIINISKAVDLSLNPNIPILNRIFGFRFRGCRGLQLRENDSKIPPMITRAIESDPVCWEGVFSHRSATTKTIDSAWTDSFDLFQNRLLDRFGNSFGLEKWKHSV